MRQRLEAIEESVTEMILGALEDFVAQRLEATAKSDMGKLTAPQKIIYERFRDELKDWIILSRDNNFIRRALNMVDADLPHMGEVEIPICDMGPLKWEIGDEKKPIVLPVMFRNTARNIEQLNKLEPTEGLRLVGLFKCITHDGIEELDKEEPEDSDPAQMELEEGVNEQAEPKETEFIERRPWYLNADSVASAYNQGFEAFQRGLEKTANPYPVSESKDALAPDWETGWEDSESHSKEHSVQFVNPTCFILNEEEVSNFIAVEPFSVFEDEDNVLCPFAGIKEVVPVAEWVVTLEVEAYEAIRQGWLARSISLKKGKNPYKKNEPLREVWLKGFEAFDSVGLGKLYELIAEVYAEHHDKKDDEPANVPEPKAKGKAEPKAEVDNVVPIKKDNQVKA